MKEKMKQLIEKLKLIEFLPLLIIRLVLAYGFYEPAMMKWKDINAISDWFAGMNYPLPKLMAYMAAGTEAIGVVFLTLGFFTRMISIPLMITMLVAIFTVHYANGFSAGDNGFEIPLYYLLMLFVLFVYGPGKISLQKLICNKK